jgi:hypothetical protein
MVARRGCVIKVVGGESEIDDGESGEGADQIIVCEVNASGRNKGTIVVEESHAGY